MSSTVASVTLSTVTGRAGVTGPSVPPPPEPLPVPLSLSPDPPVSEPLSQPLVLTWTQARTGRSRTRASVTLSTTTGRAGLVVAPEPVPLSPPEPPPVPPVPPDGTVGESSAQAPAISRTQTSIGMSSTRASTSALTDASSALRDAAGDR